MSDPIPLFPFRGEIIRFLGVGQTGFGQMENRRAGAADGFGC